MREEFGSEDEDNLYSSDDDIVPTRSKMGGAVMSKSLSTPPGIINRVESDKRLDNLKMKNKTLESQQPGISSVHSPLALRR